MEPLIIWFVSLPKPLIYALWGACGGIVGAFLGELIQKTFKVKKARGLITILCVVFALQVSHHAMPLLEKSVGHVFVMNKLKQVRLYQVIFKYHPEAESEMDNKMKYILASVPDNQALFYAQKDSAEIVERYLFKHLPNATDDATYKLMQRQLSVMRQFKDKPDLCVSYYLGRPRFVKGDLPDSFIEEESNIKADLIEGAVLTPSAPPPELSMDALADVIALGYSQKGYAKEDLSKLSEVDKLPADQGCDIATKFVDVLAAMPEDRAVLVFKNLLRLSQKKS